jgi:hypothetical protein
MDSKGRALDNRMIEGLWRTVKYDDIYVKAYETMDELYGGLDKFFCKYNTRKHQTLGMSPEQKYREIDQLLISCAGTEMIRLVRSIPGFGAKTTPAILAFIPPERLQHGSKKQITRKLQALFGTDPRVKESGKWEGTTKISKRGVGIARTTLFQTAFCGMTHDPQLRQCYVSLKARGKNHKQATIDLMRKQLARLVSVLVNQKTFTPITSQL